MVTFSNEMYYIHGWQPSTERHSCLGVISTETSEIRLTNILYGHINAYSHHIQ